uniref:Uncharacterized protein n=1 Tax=Anguilla anguilla TaxID=7936 RepID=A0A0E9TX69_ANGAN
MNVKRLGVVSYITLCLVLVKTSLIHENTFLSNDSF